MNWPSHANWKFSDELIALGVLKNFSTKFSDFLADFNVDNLTAFKADHSVLAAWNCPSINFDRPDIVGILFLLDRVACVSWLSAGFALFAVGLLL